MFLGIKHVFMFGMGFERGVHRKGPDGTDPIHNPGDPKISQGHDLGQKKMIGPTQPDPFLVAKIGTKKHMTLFIILRLTAHPDMTKGLLDLGLRRLLRAAVKLRKKMVRAVFPCPIRIPR